MCRPGRRQRTSTSELLEMFMSAPATPGHALGWYKIGTSALGTSSTWLGCYPAVRVAERAPAERRTGDRRRGFTTRLPTSPAPGHLGRGHCRLRFTVKPRRRRGWRRDGAKDGPTELDPSRGGGGQDFTFTPRSFFGPGGLRRRRTPEVLVGGRVRRPTGGRVRRAALAGEAPARSARKIWGVGFK